MPFSYPQTTKETKSFAQTSYGAALLYAIALNAPLKDRDDEFFAFRNTIIHHPTGKKFWVVRSDQKGNENGWVLDSQDDGSISMDENGNVAKSAVTKVHNKLANEPAYF